MARGAPASISTRVQPSFNLHVIVTFHEEMRTDIIFTFVSLWNKDLSLSFPLLSLYFAFFFPFPLSPVR